MKKIIPKFVRRVGVAGEYYQDIHGTWWLLNEQRGYVEVPLSSRALQYALAGGR